MKIMDKYEDVFSSEAVEEYFGKLYLDLRKF